MPRFTTTQSVLGLALSLLVGTALLVALSADTSSTSYIATRDRITTDLAGALGMGSGHGDCVRNHSTAAPISDTPWRAAAFKVLADEYVAGIMAGSYGACAIPVKGLGGAGSEVISRGRYWFATEQPEPRLRDSLFVQYFSAGYGAFRYDEIFVYDAEYDTKVSGSEMLETSNFVDGVFGNINLAPGINNKLELSPLYGGTVQATAPGSCITRGGLTMPTAHDLTDKSVGTYLGLARFPKGFMQEGELFDAYKVINRWPVPGAVIIMYVDRTPHSRNFGYVSTWLIFQTGPDGSAGKNYWWDFSGVLTSGAAARKKFDFNPDYYFKIPKHLVDGCDFPSATLALPLGNMTKAWLPGHYGAPTWINGTTKAVRPSKSS